MNERQRRRVIDIDMVEFSALTVSRVPSGLTQSW